MGQTETLRGSLMSLHCTLSTECQKLAATTLAMEPYVEHSEPLTGHLLVLNDRLVSLAAVRDQLEGIIKGGTVMTTTEPRLHDLHSVVLREYSKLQTAVQVLRDTAEDSKDDAFHGVVFLLEDTIENMKGLGDQIEGIIREVWS